MKKILKFIILGVPLVVIFCMLWNLQWNFNLKEKKAEMRACNDGWLMETEEGLQPISLAQTVTMNSERLVLQKLVTSAESRSSVLIFPNNREAISFEIDGETFYQINTTEVSKILRISAYCYVPLPDSYGGYVLKMIIHGEPGEICQLPFVVEGIESAANIWLFRKDSFTIVLVVLMLVLESVLLIIMLFVRMKKVNDRRLRCLALFLAFVIVWAVTDSSLSVLLEIPTEVAAVITYYVMMIIAVPIVYFVWYSCNRKYNVLRYLGIAGYGNVLFQTAMAFGGVARLEQMLFLSHLLIALIIGISLICVYGELKRRPDKIVQYLMNGFMVLALATLLAVVEYWRDGSKYRVILMMGILIFLHILLYMLIYSYLTTSRNSELKMAELKLYEQLSLSDKLTGLGNRRAFENKMESIERMTDEEVSNVVLIMIDLNGLKYTNDSYGHTAGDELIVAAAHCIKAAYGPHGKCFRIGGDEFAIVVEKNIEELSIMHKCLEIAVREYNEAATCRLSVAKGESSLYTASGKRHSISEWKREADVNMYVNKMKRREEYRHGETEEFKEIISCIIATVEAKDAYTADHSSRVSEIAVLIANNLGLSPKTISEIRVAARLHDIGKVGIPDSILRKNGKLNDVEWEMMKEHPVIGAKIVARAESMYEVSRIILYHHERYNGSGYPENLSGEDIPIGSRIIAVADSIDAMTSERCYRRALSSEECKEEIKKYLEISYDPAIGQIALEHWNEIEEIIK